MLIVATVDREMEDERILGSMTKIVTMTREQLPWLR